MCGHGLSQLICAFCGPGVLCAFCGPGVCGPGVLHLGHRWHTEQFVKLFLVSNLVFAHQLRAEVGLRRRRHVAHRRDLIAGPDVLSGIAVTIQAPLHLERFLLDHQRHLVDAAVAGFTADALGDVDAVIEIHEVRQIVDAHPVERLVVAEAGPHRLEVRAGVPDLRVAVDAGLGRRNARRRRHFHRRVAIAALDADAADMMLVAELHRLLDELVCARDEVRSLQRQNDPADAKQPENQRNNAGLRPRVCALWEYLRHAFLRSCGPGRRGTTQQ